MEAMLDKVYKSVLYSRGQNSYTLGTDGGERDRPSSNARDRQQSSGTSGDTAPEQLPVDHVWLSGGDRAWYSWQG